MSTGPSIERFYKKRHRSADGTLYYMATGFTLNSHTSIVLKLIKQPLADWIKGEVSDFAKEEWMLTTNWIRDTKRGTYRISYTIYMADKNDFLMLKLRDPTISSDECMALIKS